MAWIEQVERRGQKVKHYLDDVTGQGMSELTIHDTHYRDANNAWQDVDETLVDDGVGGFSKKCDKTRHQFRVASGGAYRWYPRRNITTEYVDITGIEYYTNRWRALNLPAAVWKTQGAEWDTTNVFASITNTWRRIKADFILKNTAAPTRLRFAIALTGLTLDGWNVKSGAEIVGRIDPPTAYDAVGSDLTPNVPVTATYAGGYIEWSVNTSGKIFPIVIDPTFTDGYGGDATTAKDATLYEGGADNNYGAGTVFYGYFTGADRCIGQIQYDLSTISAGSTCDSATHYMTANNAFVGTLAFNHHKTTQAWTEGTKNGAAADTGECTWNYRVHNTARWAGDTGSNGGTDAGCSVSGTDYEAGSIGLISQVNPLAKAEYNVGLTASEVAEQFGGALNMVLVPAGTTNNWDAQFCTSDNATTGYRPKLVVVWTAAGGAMVGSAAGTSSASGALSGVGELAGTATAVGTPVAALIGAGALIGAAAGLATVAANLSGISALAGSMAGIASASAALAGAGELAGTSSGIAGVAGALVGSGALAGAIAGIGSATGSMVQPDGAMVGAIAGQASVSGTLAGSGALSGASAGTSTALAILVMFGYISGVASGVSIADGTMAGAGELTGAAGGVSIADASLVGAGWLSGPAYGTSIVSGTLLDYVFFTTPGIRIFTPVARIGQTRLPASSRIFTPSRVDRTDE